jgi:uncharacterized protein involved in exopolysaccharide biosynthesis
MDDLSGDDSLVQGRAGPSPSDWAALTLRAVRRRPWIAVGTFLLAFGASAAYFASKTALYRVEAKLHVERQQPLPSSLRYVNEDHPERSAWELVHRRENLVELLRVAGVIESGGDRSAAPPPGSGGSWYARLFRSRENRQRDPVETLTEILDKRLLVTVEDSTISFQLDWPDPHVSYVIVQNAMENFLEGRHIQEIQVIDEVIAVLKGKANALRGELDTAIQQAQARPVAARNVVATKVRTSSPELVRLGSLLESKRRAIEDVEEFRRRRLLELQAQLAQARTGLSDAHPTVQRLQADIAASSQESSQIAALREEEQTLRKQYSDRLALEGAQPVAPAAQAQGVPVIPLSREEDPRVRDLRLQHEQMVSRIIAAEAELDTARASFKYRYKVIWPPEHPTDPVSPNPRKIFGAGLLGSLLLALFAAAAPDLLRGRIVERWQVERALRVPVLGEITEK